MEYYVLNAEQVAIIQNVLPQDILHTLETGEAFAIIGTSGQEAVTGVAVYAYDSMHTDEMILTWVYTAEEYREQGVASGVMKFAENIWKEQGITHISCYINGEVKDIMDITSFLETERYRPVVLDWRILEYGGEKILENKRLYSFKDAAKVNFQKLSKTQLRYMIKQDRVIPQMTRELLQMETDIDLDSSLFYIGAEKLHAAVIVTPMGKNVFSISGIYINPQLKQKATILIMLANAIFSQELDRDAKVRLMVDDSKVFSLYESIFGKADKVIFIQKYTKTLE